MSDSGSDAVRRLGRGRGAHAAGGGRKTRWGHVLGTVFVLAWTVPPFLYLILLSVKPEPLMVERSVLIFWPTFERYLDVVISNFGAPIWTSLVTSTTGALFTLILASLAGVTFSFLDFRGKAALFLLILVP